MAGPLLTINSVYQRFWDSFSLHCKPLGEIKGNPRLKRTPDGVTLDCLIFLKGWPYKAQSKRTARKLDILIRANESYDTSLRINRSVIHVIYLELEGEDYRVVQNVHYDFEELPDPGHPIFHAQFGNKLIDDLEKFSELSLPDAMLKIAASDEKAYKNLRVPTPHMNFASVLFGLAADHLEHSEFSIFCKACENLLDCIPDAVCDALRKNSREDSYSFKSVHWYHPTKPLLPTVTVRKKKKGLKH